MKTKSRTGAAILIYLLVMAVFIAFLMAITYSRLLVALRRGQSSSDTMIAQYSAESEIFDIMARLSGGYLRPPFSETKTISGTKISVNAAQNGNTQEVTIVADRAFASIKLIGTRLVSTTNATSALDIALMLDCTRSMDSRANPKDPLNRDTRFDALRKAAITFVQNVGNLNSTRGGGVRLGVGLFGTEAKWMNYGGYDISPITNTSYTTIEQAIRTGITTTKDDPQSACRNIREYTSVGTAYNFANSFFAQNKKPNTKQIIVTVTDGEPNSRTVGSAGKCMPNIECVYGACGGNSTCQNKCRSLGVDFTRCTIADSATRVPQLDEQGQNTRPLQSGERDPNVDAYAIVVIDGVPADVSDIFTTYLGDRYYPASNASLLTEKFNAIFNDILENTESISIKKVDLGD